MLGIGIGGTAEKAVALAKESLMEPIDMGELKARGPQNDIEKLRIEIFDKVNALGIGAQGLGGLSTILDVKIYDYPCRSEEHTSELQSLMRISYAVFCLKKKKKKKTTNHT